MHLLNEILIVLAESKCDTCKLKDQCNKMKEEKDETLCKYLFELDERYFWNKNNIDNMKFIY